MSFYDTVEETDRAEFDLVLRKKEELGDLCINLHDGGNGGEWVKYHNAEQLEARRQLVVEGVRTKTTPEWRKMNAKRAGLAKNNVPKERKEEWAKHYSESRLNMEPEAKKQLYDKVSQKMKQYYENATEEELIEKNRKNKESNVLSSRQWRKEFFDLFFHTPEYFRQFGMQGEATKLFKKVKNLHQEVKESEVKRFMESIGVPR